MLTTNIDIDDRLVNGLVGRVIQFKYSHDAVSVVYVKFNDASAGLLAMRSDATAQLQHWVPVKKREALFGLRKNKCQPSVKRTQFPLTLSWACTVHKVQGLSLTEGVVSFDLESQKSFNQGQMYVALSRISSINKLYLVGKYKKEAIKVNLAAKKEYERLRRESLFNMQPQYEVTESSITLSLLKTRSLQKHFMDIAMDRRLMANDLLCLTETQLRPSSDTSIVESALQYKMHFNNSENQFKSIAYGYASDIDVIAQEDFDGISIFTFKKEPFFSNPISVGLIYRCQHLQPVMFLDCVRNLVNREIDILLGDFNIDALDEMSYNRLKEVLCNYNLQVSEPTHLDGALLDQIYLRNSFEHNKIVRSMVNNIYFSDHDAVKLELKFRKIDEEDIDFNFNA